MTSEFSYRSKYCAADGLLLAGDAFAFLDPVFSSGVFLALKSGEIAADAVDAALTAGDTSGARFAEYGRAALPLASRTCASWSMPFTITNFSFGRVIKAHPHLRGQLTDCLIGDLFSDFSELFARVEEFAALPPPLPHGRTAAPSTLEAVESHAA